LRGGWTSLLRWVAEDRRAADREEISSPCCGRNGEVPYRLWRSVLSYTLLASLNCLHELLRSLNIKAEFLRIGNRLVLAHRRIV
jgi:hypothetical protein